MPVTEYHLVDELEESLCFKKSNIPKNLLAKPILNMLIKHAIADWGIIIALCILLIFLPGWCYPFIALLLASRYHSFGVILHDIVHMPMKKKTLKFRVLEVLTGYPIGSTINAMRYHHLRHHKDSGMHTDPYFKKGVNESKLIKNLFIFRGIILIPFWIIRGIYGTLAYYIISLRNGYARVFLQEKSGKDCIYSPEVIQCASEDRGQLAFHIILFSTIYWAPSFFIYCYGIPILISGIFAGYRLMNEHFYIETSDRKLETIIATTRDNHLSGFLKYFLAPKNIGYHIVHHLHPQVAWYNLPELRKWYLQNYSDIYVSK